MKILFCLGLSAAVLAGCGGGGNTNDCNQGVNFCNIPPDANAGAPQNVLVGATITLDGSQSSDANGDVLTYAWSVVSRPAGSTATLTSATSVNPTFVADMAGVYGFSLTVRDGKSNSVEKATTITASNTNLTITTGSYSNGGTIPLRIAATAVGGSNTSPQLIISDIPKGTQRFAVIMDDETQPTCQPGLGACRHWGVFNLPVAKTSISEGENLLLQSGAVYGTNYTGSVGYAGPNASSQHTYKLTVYALSAEATFVTAVPEYNRAKFELAFQSTILGKATLTGVYP